jgi:hypothetical protein
MPTERNSPPQESVTCFDEARYRMFGACVDDCADEAALAQAILDELLSQGEQDGE